MEIIVVRKHSWLLKLYFTQVEPIMYVMENSNHVSDGNYGPTTGTNGPRITSICANVTGGTTYKFTITGNNFSSASNVVVNVTAAGTTNSYNADSTSTSTTITFSTSAYSANESVSITVTDTNINDTSAPVTYSVGSTVTF